VDTSVAYRNAVYDRTRRRAGSCGHPQDLAVRAGNLQVHPVLAVLAGVKWPVRGYPVDGA